MLVFFILDLEESFLSFLELLCRSRSKTKVPVEVIIIDEVWSDGFQIYEYIIELLQDEKALCHALTTWDSITLRW